MSSEAAETLALRAIAFALAEDDRRDRLLALTGLTPDSLRAGLTDPAVQAGVLDFLLGHEPDLLAFAEEAGIDPGVVLQARRQFPGFAGWD